MTSSSSSSTTPLADATRTAAGAAGYPAAPVPSSRHPCTTSARRDGVPARRAMAPGGPSPDVPDGVPAGPRREIVSKEHLVKSIVRFAVGVAAGFVARAPASTPVPRAGAATSRSRRSMRRTQRPIRQGHRRGATAERDAELRAAEDAAHRSSPTDARDPIRRPLAPGRPHPERNPMQTADIAPALAGLLRERGHTIVPSASLVTDDPTLLFTVAGMVPFMPYLSGLVPSPYPRATSVQKCIRTNDIEEVGKTPRHGTFFQMIGNFSFGDYFKEGAISLRVGAAHQPEADGGLRLRRRRTSGSPSTRTTTRRIELWKRIAGLPEERIQRLGKDTNYWHTGQPGPGRPLLRDLLRPRARVRHRRRPGHRRRPLRRDLEPRVHAVRYRRRDARRTTSASCGELPKKNIDTGMGLERVAFIKQGVENMYETDQVRPVLDRAAELSGRALRRRPRRRRAHARRSPTTCARRSCCMTDGVTPVERGSRLHPAPPACAARSARCACSASTDRPSASCSPRRATR